MFREIDPSEFTPESLEHIFRHIETEAGFPVGRGNSAYFFKNWQSLMQSGIARTWVDSDCVLGAIFYPDVFNGEKRASVQFFFSLPEARGSGRPVALLTAYEFAARKAGCKHSAIASFETLNPTRAEKLYQRMGYALTESIFSKAL